VFAGGWVENLKTDQQEAGAMRGIRARHCRGWMRWDWRRLGKNSPLKMGGRLWLAWRYGAAVRRIAGVRYEYEENPKNTAFSTKNRENGSTPKKNDFKTSLNLFSVRL